VTVPETPIIPEKPVIIKTFGDLIKHDYRLNGTCRGCGVNRDVDLAQCPPRRTFIGQRFKCRDCGASVMITLSPIHTCNDAPLPGIERWRGND
jgi:hypothetical protein